jgi:hypothetical protein
MCSTPSHLRSTRGRSAKVALPVEAPKIDTFVAHVALVGAHCETKEDGEGVKYFEWHNDDSSVVVRDYRAEGVRGDSLCRVTRFSRSTGLTYVLENVEGKADPHATWLHIDMLDQPQEVPHKGVCSDSA